MGTMVKIKQIMHIPHPAVIVTCKTSCCTGISYKKIEKKNH